MGTCYWARGWHEICGQWLSSLLIWRVENGVVRGCVIACLIVGANKWILQVPTILVTNSQKKKSHFSLSLSLSLVQTLFPQHNYFSILWSRGQLRKNLNIPISTPLFWKNRKKKKRKKKKDRGVRFFFKITK